MAPADIDRAEKKNLADVFLYLVLLLASLWAARLAMSKGHNVWGWGGAALLLGLIHLPESALFSVVPVLLLMLMKSPASSTAARPDRLSCPRCAKSHLGGQHFCTGCGWDLSQAYSPEEQEGSQQSPTQSQTQTQTSTPTTSVAEHPESADIPAPEAPTSAQPTASGTEVAEAIAAGQEAEPAAENAQDSVDATGEATGMPAEVAEAEEEPETEHVPWGTYAIGVAPTATVMTSRGIERFDEGKYQEAIDQFTKAIGLDPNYADAWQRRAEAYAQLGRSELAAEDRRHFQGLDPSSSPG